MFLSRDTTHRTHDFRISKMKDHINPLPEVYKNDTLTLTQKQISTMIEITVRDKMSGITHHCVTGVLVVVLEEMSAYFNTYES